MAATGNGDKRRFWHAHVRAWARSGLSQSEYCRRRGLSRSLFGYWKKRLRPEDAAREAASVQLVAVEPRVVEAAVGAVSRERGPAVLAVRVGDRYRVEVGDGFSPATLVRLVRTIESL